MAAGAGWLLCVGLAHGADSCQLLLEIWTAAAALLLVSVAPRSWVAALTAVLAVRDAARLPKLLAWLLALAPAHDQVMS